MKLHAGYGYALLSVDGAPPLFAEIAKYHDERYDGFGYNGLESEEIQVEASVVRVADVYEVLTSMIADMPSPGFGRRSFNPGYLRVFVRLRLENDLELADSHSANQDSADRIERIERIRALREFAGSDPTLDYARLRSGGASQGIGPQGQRGEASLSGRGGRLEE